MKGSRPKSETYFHPIALRSQKSGKFKTEFFSWLGGMNAMKQAKQVGNLKLGFFSFAWRYKCNRANKKKEKFETGYSLC